MSYPTLLFYCQHSMGLGHLVRSLALAQGLAARFQVVLLSGGPLPADVTIPDAVDVIELPPLGQSVDGSLLSRHAGTSIAGARRLRRQRILETFWALRPRVVFIELFPFGRKKFAGELLPLLQEARRMEPLPPLVLCSLRDLLVSRRDQPLHELRASLLTNHYFDAVLVHSDPHFARLEETFQPRVPLRLPVHYTGFVVPEKSPCDAEEAQPSDPPRVVVSAGGGIAGASLLHAALDAQPILWREERLGMLAIAGPFLPEEEWQELQRVAAMRAGLEVRRFVPDLCAEMRSAVASVSQCGYNTAMDILLSGVPALVVPFCNATEDEQMNRARRLERLGIVRVLPPSQADGRTLAAEVRQLLHFKPAAVRFNVQGVANTVRIVEELLPKVEPIRGARNRATAGAGRWLDPLRRVLDSSHKKIVFFFRDDDAGWEDRRLMRLLSLFEHLALPIDLAVIPKALTPSLAGDLRTRAEAMAGRLALHQHGYAHVNHESTGRRYEFGPSRSREAQRRDIVEGRRLLSALLGTAVAPIFTPPWNRCTDITGRCLIDLGYEILSRDATARPLNLPGLHELSVAIDWFSHKKGVRLSREEVGGKIAAEARTSRRVGIMFHHAVMDAEEMAAASELLFLLATHPSASCLVMKDVAARICKPNPAAARG